MKKLRCALYTRVSTGESRGRQTPENQSRILREFAASQNWEIVAEYTDRMSGAKADRPEFQRMMTAASKRQFDVLLFWSIDRFSREGIVPVLTKLKRLSHYGIKYRSHEEPYIDTTSEWGDLLAAFVAKIAELERKRIRARIMAGLERAKAEGKTLGRRRLVIDRQKVWNMRTAGHSINEIAASMKLSHGTVQRTLEAAR